MQPICYEDINSIYYLKSNTFFSDEAVKQEKSELEGEVCNFCYKLVNKKHLQVHKIAHTGEKPYQCELCNKSFSRPDKLTQHQKTHKSDRPNKYVCFCGKQYSHLELMKVHANTHIDGSQLDLNDPDLVKLLQSYDEDPLNLIPASVHVPPDSHECPFCYVFFFGSYKYTRHVRTHTGEKPFLCKCGVRFNRSELLKKHHLSGVCNYMENSEKNLHDSDISNDIPLSLISDNNNRREDITCSSTNFNLDDVLNTSISV